MSKSEVYVGRQPILDSGMGLFAYELQFHQGLNPNGHSLAATEALMDQIEQRFGFEALLGNEAALLTVPASLLTPERVPVIDSRHPLILSLSTDVLRSTDILKNLKALKVKGYHFLVNNYNGDAASEKLATIVEYAKIQVSRFDDETLQAMLRDLHQQGIKVIADTVQNDEQYRHLKRLGFDCFLGHFFTNPTVANGKKLSGNRLTLLQLMAKVNDPQTDFASLTQILEQDVGLSHKLLMAINHPANDVPVQVASIGDGLKYMGLKRLKFWINLLMLSEMEDVPQALLTTSLQNAQFCALMAEQSGHAADKDSYFLVGLLCHLDAYFQLPMAELLAALPLSDVLNAALLEQAGPMGEVLRILNVLQHRADQAEQLTFEGLGIAQISHNFMAAAAWARQAVSA